MSRINPVIQGPRNVPDGRIDGRGLTFNAPLAAIGQSLSSAGAMGNQLANHYKRIHDTNIAKKAEVEFEQRIGEAQLALEAAPSPSAFSEVLAAESDALALMADEMVERVDGPQLRAQMMNNMNLRSGRFAIQARGMLFKQEEAEFKLGLENDVNDLREQGDHDGAIAVVMARGPLGLSGERVRGMVNDLEHERDFSNASSAVESYREGAGPRPAIESYGNLTPDDRLQLRRRISVADDRRSGRVSVASMSDTVDDLVGEGANFSEGMAAIRSRLEASGLVGDELEQALSPLEDEYLVTEIGHALSMARRDGTLESYNRAIAFAQDPRFEKSPDALNAAASAIEYLRNGVNSLSLGDESDRSFVREASLRVPPALTEMLSQVEYLPDGGIIAPTEAAFREAMASAIGLDSLDMPQMSPDGELISEGDISVAAMHGALGTIDAAWEQFRESIEDSQPETLWSLSQGPASNTSPAARAQMLDRLWPSIETGQDADPAGRQIFIDAMNTQGAVVSEIAQGVMGGLSGAEANASFHTMMSTLRNEGLSPRAFKAFREQGAAAEGAYLDFISLNDAFQQHMETSETPEEALKAARQSISNASEADAGEAFLKDYSSGQAPAFEQAVAHYGLSLVSEEGERFTPKELLAEVEAHFLDQHGLGEDAGESSRFIARSMAGDWLDALHEAAEGMPLRDLTGDEMKALIDAADESVRELGFGATRFSSAGDGLAMSLHPPEIMYGITGDEGGLTRGDSILFPALEVSSRAEVRSSYIGERAIREVMSSMGSADLSAVIGPSLGSGAERAYGRLHSFWTGSSDDLRPSEKLARAAIRELNYFHAMVSNGVPEARLSSSLGSFTRDELIAVHNELGSLIRDVNDVSARMIMSPQDDPAPSDEGAAWRRISGARDRNLPRSRRVSTVQYEASFVGTSGETLSYKADGVQPYYEGSLLYYQDLVARRLHTLAGESPLGRFSSGLREGYEGLGQRPSPGSRGRGDWILNMAPPPEELDSIRPLDR